MTIMNSLTNRLYPGLGCTATEFFTIENEVKVLQNGKVLPFSEASVGTIRIIEEAIDKDKNVKRELTDMHPDSKWKRTIQFVRCRFGGLDFQGDIKDGVLQDGEFWDCPNRGNCKSEGILCKLPTYNEQRLTTQDVALLQLLATDKTNEVIAEDLNLPLGSLHKAKKYLYVKLGIQTKQEGVMISFFLNLIQFKC